MRNKILHRGYPIFLNALKSVLSPLLSLTLSYLIVHFYGKGLWGEFVRFLLFFYIEGIVTNWGSKMYLLRSFSKNPSKIIDNWQSYFLIRVPWVFIFLILTLFFYELKYFPYLAIWLLGLFIKNSFVPVVYYKRDFGKLIFADSLGYIILFLILYFTKQDFNLDRFISLYAISILISSTCYLFFYKSFLKKWTGEFKTELLLLGLPFTLLAITGFLHSKIDLYVFNFYTNKSTLGSYQIVSSLFVFLQYIAGIIIFPYLKNIYRMSEKSLNKMKTAMILYGLIITLFGTFFIALILNLYGIYLPRKAYIIGFFISFPCFIYTIDIYEILKIRKEKIVVGISFIALLLNFFISIFLLELGMKIEGVLLSNALTQITTIFLYLRVKKISHKF